jgi:hypothetical protein
MKFCSTCNQTLPLGEFAPSVARRYRNGGPCKACRRVYGMAYYRKHKARINQHRLVNMTRYRARNRANVDEYLSSHPCVDCGEPDVRVLEFDHVRGQKEGNVGDLVGEGLAWQRILSEISKCEVRCANCHRRKTVQQFGRR